MLRMQPVAVAGMRTQEAAPVAVHDRTRRRTSHAAQVADSRDPHTRPCRSLCRDHLDPCPATSLGHRASARTHLALLAVRLPCRSSAAAIAVVRRGRSADRSGRVSGSVVDRTRTRWPVVGSARMVVDRSERRRMMAVRMAVVRRHVLLLRASIVTTCDPPVRTCSIDC